MGGTLVTGKKLKFVYIAGPMTMGSYPTNVRNAILVADSLLEHGFVPYLPHLTALWGMVTGDKTFDQWLAYDEAWLAKCDCVLRIQGESLGADREVAFARENGIHVFYNESDLYAARNAWASSNTSTTGSVPSAVPSLPYTSSSVRGAEKNATQTT